jgi:hypothetical protein
MMDAGLPLFRNLCPMPDPLPSDVVARLKSDPTAALAAALILAGSFPDLVLWAMKAFGDQSDAANCELKPPGHGARGAGESNGFAKSGGRPGQKFRGRAKAQHAPRETAAKHDQALLALMRANPDANVTEIIRMNGRPRNSTVLSLERLKKTGRVEHSGRGKWTVVDPAPKPPGPQARGWIEPLSGAHVARHAADGRVRDELTMA